MPISNDPATRAICGVSAIISDTSNGTSGRQYFHGSQFGFISALLLRSKYFSVGWSLTRTGIKNRCVCLFIDVLVSWYRSSTFVDFVARALQKEPERRSSSSDLIRVLFAVYGQGPIILMY